MKAKALILLLAIPGVSALLFIRLRSSLGGGRLWLAFTSLFGSREGRPPSPLERLRANWGRKITRERDLDFIAQYHRFVAGNRETVDEQTWQDLGMDEVFAGIERAVSLPGRQILYARLRAYGAAPAVLAERTRQYGIYRQDAGLREQMQLLLGRLDGKGAEYLAPLLLSRFPPAPELGWLLYLASAMPALCLLAMIFFPPLLMAVLLFLGVNTVIFFTYGQKITPYFAGFAQIEAMLGAADGLGNLENRHALPELQELRGAQPMIRQLRRRLGWLIMDRAAFPDLLQGFFLYLNMFFLCDVLIFLRSRAALEHEQAALARMFETVGSLDASLAVASYLEELPDYCIPTTSADRRLQVDQLRHPLVPGAVSNSLGLNGRSAVIAGPNMAGKTCFIRTVGINLLLGQTLNFCLARSATMPRVVVRSAIRREDMLEEGRSYFFAEIKQILEFVQTKEGPPLHFFLIDEIFRGTNTGERIASSVAVLRHLARAHLVLVTTHDSELQELLGDAFDMHHFSDCVDEKGYGFDYLIRPGPAQSHNAIKLLELSGYPKSITSEAEALAEIFKANPRVKLT